MEHTDDGTPAGPEPGQEHPSAGARRLSADLEHIVRTLAEMEQGMRPVGALDTLASPLAARRIRKVVHTARAAGRGSTRGRTAPPKVRSSTFSHPSAGVTEGVVIIEREARARAYCVRVEQEGERWRIVELAPADAGLRAAVTEASRTGKVPLDEDGVRRSSGGEGTGFSSPPTHDGPTLLIEPGATGTDPAGSDAADDEQR